MFQKKIINGFSDFANVIEVTFVHVDRMPYCEV